MIAALADHLWQSTAFAAFAGVFALAFRGNRAAVRYAVWLAASVKFLIPCSALLAIGAALASFVHVDPASISAFSRVVQRVAQPVSTGLAPAGASIAIDASVPALAALWLVGFVGVVAIRLRGWRAVRAVARTATRIAASPDRFALDVRSSTGLLEPGVVGMWHPMVLLPAGLETRLPPAQLDAILAHEASHIRRRDNATAAAHMAVEAVFWFHPVVWWIGARLIAERERACDEAVLQTLDEPRIYADALLAICRGYVESPIACVSGVSASQLTSRIERILQAQIGAQMNATKRISLGLALLLALLAPVVIGATTLPDQGRSGGSARAIPSGTPQEVALRTALFELRDAIDRFQHDTNRYPRNLDMLVRQGYLKAVPIDPFTNSASTWRIVRDPKNPKTTGVFDVKSGSAGIASDGSKHSDW